MTISTSVSSLMQWVPNVNGYGSTSDPRLCLPQPPAKPSATKNDVKVAEIIETGKKICTFATNSNNHATNHRYSFHLSHLRKGGLPESSPLSASNSVCAPAQAGVLSAPDQSGLLQTGRLLPVLSQLRTCALCLRLRPFPRRDAPQAV